MNQSHIAAVSSASVGVASVGICVWLISLAGITVPTDVVEQMIVIATFITGTYFHKNIGDQNAAADSQPDKSAS